MEFSTFIISSVHFNRSEVAMSIGTIVKFEKLKKQTFQLFYAIIGWPRIDIENANAVKAIERFMFFGKLSLIYQHHPNAVHPITPTKWFTYLSVTIDFCTFITVIRFICGFFTDNLLILAYLGDVFVGLRHAYALRMLALFCIACLGGFRAITCYLVRNGSLDWTKVIDKAMIDGWKPEVLNMKKGYCLKWRQTSVCIARKIVVPPLVHASVWITCFTYLTLNCKTFYVVLKSQLILGLFVFWQVTTLISIIWFVFHVVWISLLYFITFFYVINKSNSIYSEIQESSKFKLLSYSALNKLCNKNISFLNEFDNINHLMRYISYSGYILASLAGQVAMLYSYLGLFGMPLADLGLGIIGFNGVFQMGVVSFLAAKSVANIGLSYSRYHRIYQNNYNIEPRLKLKLLYNLDRLGSPFVGFWVGESFSNDNRAFIQYLFETCCNMMLISVTMSNFTWKN
uniref:Gustatory receptor n=1 Tax=Tetranychus urticae TaxID=32264 RepID=T1K0T7_TETUR